MSSRRKNRSRVMRVGIPAIAAAAVGASVWGFTAANATSASVELPPVNAGFDYQIGEAYTPPSGVKVVSRDNADAPAKGLYNICYINAFQSQPDHEGDWKGLLLEGKDGSPAEDPDWPGEYALDITTPAKRTAIADKVDAVIDTCASKGFNAIEPDNYDSYTRFDGLTADEAKAYMTLLVQHAHEKNLAIAQKNTAELAPDAKSLGIDFAVTEECGMSWGDEGGPECSQYEKAFGDHVLDVEYSDEGFKAACDGWSGKFSVVKRDEDVSAPGSDAYVRETCSN
ncbi:endo alpha-1,4 polygalactosaminidase [Streptomyces sp. NBC_01471]|uniref:endo alpha-1,4 polygalactosaminidase n=1 Tax=Streptomyces sp. NBC_01471 TaxID=2903879 RepID=UPI003243FBC9